jgi:hypothetical protein
LGQTAQVFDCCRVYWVRDMFGTYDKDLMRRGAAARSCISEGEDPFRMLLQVVWPDHDWAESAMLARLTSCPACRGRTSACSECGSTGLVTEERRKALAIETLAKVAFDAA